MMFTQSIVILGLLCLDATVAVAISLPAITHPQPVKRSVTINRVAAGWRERDAFHAKVTAMRKFGMKCEPELLAAHAAIRKKKSKGRRKHGSKHSGKGSASATVAALGAASTGSAVGAGIAGVNATQATGQVGNVTNTPVEGDVEFLSEVTIGGQKIVMNFDTGSSDLWVFSTNLLAKAQQGHTVFDPAKSTTFQAQDPAVGSSFDITFGDGSSATGSKKSKNTIGLDTVDIGGAVAQQQTVELADQVSGSFITDTASNGLVGLAFSSINTVKPTKAKTFFDTIADDLAEPILAADLKPGVAGSYTFGKVDNTAFTGQLTEVPVDNSQGFWQFASSTFTVNGGKAQKNTDNSPAIADTGTTLLIADPAVVNGYYSQVQGAQLSFSGMAVFPCSATLPDLSLAVGDTYQAVIPGKLLNFQILDKAGTTCLGALQSNNGGGVQIYGDIFFKAQYTVFNLRKETISVAAHA